jgi:tetratricopeptide (TPR) repeat protein
MIANLRALAILAILAIQAVSAFGQGDIELAEYYYRNGEYEQARLYYEKIWKSDKSNRVYENYLGTLVALGDLPVAEDLIKKKLKSKGDNSVVYIDLGSLYLQFNKPEEANKQFDEALKELQPGRSQAIRLANAFIKLNLFDYALASYERGQKITKDGYLFHFEIANVQGMMGQHEAMVNSFIELLVESPNYIQTVQNSLTRTLNPIENEASGEMLRVKLLQATQKYPNEAIFSEMLIWLFNQRKEFYAALTHAKALDQRFNENGLRVMEIGNMALRNEDWDAAAAAYSYVVSKGPTSEYFVSARSEMLRAKLASLTASILPEQAAFKALADDYEQALLDLGKVANTAGMMKELAHIYAFHLQDPKRAAEILEEAIALPGIYDQLQAQCKLELADILLLDGDIWEASLLYSQVELTYKEDVLGAEAKFRNARISYFTADFDWAQAQLDVLKASTTKLISNDAIDLSLLITDNYNMDTTTVPMRLYAEADLLSYQNRWNEANAKLDSILTVFPGHTLKDEILMMKARMYLARGEFATAEAQLNEVLELHFTDILADDALFMLAELNERVYENTEKAMELYKQLMADYPGSLFVVESRKRFRQLRGDQLE